MYIDIKTYVPIIFPRVGKHLGPKLQNYVKKKKKNLKFVRYFNMGKMPL